MEDVKVQVTTENIAYKKTVGKSFAKLINALIELARTDKEVEAKMFEIVKREEKQ